MKLDCEGSEVAIIKRLKEFPNKLVLEYDGGHHKRKADYDDFVAFLKQKYKTVVCPVLKDDIKFFPNGLNIRCVEKF